MVCDACVEDKYNKIIREHYWHHNYAEMPSLMANIHRTVLKIMSEKCDDCQTVEAKFKINDTVKLINYGNEEAKLISFEYVVLRKNGELMACEPDELEKVGL